MNWPLVYDSIVPLARYCLIDVSSETVVTLALMIPKCSSKLILGTSLRNYRFPGVGRDLQLTMYSCVRRLSLDVFGREPSGIASSSRSRSLGLL